MKSSMKSGNRKEYELVFSMHALSEKIARWTGKNESQTTAISGLTLFRRESPTGPINGLYEPSLCLVAQGSKRVLLGEDTYIYDSQNYLITSLHLPTIVQVTEASREKPYLGLKMTLDPKEISQMMLDNPIPPPPNPAIQPSHGNRKNDTAFIRSHPSIGRPSIGRRRYPFSSPYHSTGDPLQIAGG